MPFIVLVVAMIIAVVAFRNQQGALGSALEQDGKGYLTWAAAVVAIGAIGYIPGLDRISKWLLALVIVVLVLRNYQGIISGFEAVSGTSASASIPTPAAVDAGGTSASSTTGLNPPDTSGGSTSSATGGATNLPSSGFGGGVGAQGGADQYRESGADLHAHGGGRAGRSHREVYSSHGWDVGGEANRDAG